MPDVNEARHEIEEVQRNSEKIARLSKFIFRILKKGVALLTKGLDKIFHFSAGEKSYRNIVKNAQNTSIIENLSKEDLREMKRQAKKWNIKYSILQVKEDEVQNVNKFTKLMSFFSRKKEEPNYAIVYDIKYTEIMSKILKKVVDARIDRQTSLDPSLRTDFNKDGIVDEKDLNIENRNNDLKATDMHINQEYGTVHRIDFRDKKHIIYEISKEDYEKIYLETQIKIQSFSAYVAKNLKNEEVVNISISPKKKENMNEIFLAYDVVPKGEMIVNYDIDKRKIDPEHCYHIEMKDEDFNEFQNLYKETSYNAYKTDHNWSVIINSDSVKKNYEKSTSEKSLEDLYKEIQPTKEDIKLNEVKEVINEELTVDDLNLDDIEIKLGN